MFVLCVLLSRLQRLSGVGVVLTSLALDWCSGMVSKLRGGVRGLRVKSVQKESWQVRSR